MLAEKRTLALSYQEITHPEISSIRVFPTPEETARGAAEEIVRVVQANPSAAITYATGDTMIPVYAHLTQAVQGRQVSFAETIGFHLDEYYPTGPEPDKYPHSFVSYLRQRVFGPLQIAMANELNGLAPDPEAEVRRYDGLLSAQLIDLAILGIGPWSDTRQSGCHIALNESGTPFSTRTHVAELNEVTVSRDRQERGQDTPSRALTQGIANILEAKQIYLIAYGENKGMSLREALYGEVGVRRPASALRVQGHKVKMFIDRAAASQLKES
ncbi:MAG: glucosamine-6-phosphate deaminase [Patescibacteria group bacterium]|nr:glucosamine-6-phosphate deaminase [Patescibacteria group bacterium]MCL5095362.1 glucosamine-6-phosphate deaminase [Patescibacteria group bacterium]